MYNHPIIDLLKSFSGKEMMWFAKFLRSPYFNNRNMLTNLFMVLKQFYPGFESRKLTKEYIFRKLYGKKKDYNDSTLRNLMSDLLQMALLFLKQEGTEKNAVESSFFLTEELFGRGNYDLFKNQMSKNENELKKRSNIDGNYFLSNYRINTDSFYVNLLTQKVLKKNYVITESEKMIDGIAYILSYFVTESIKHNDNLLKYSRSYNIKKNITAVGEFTELFNFEKIISYIEKNTTLHVPQLAVYYYLLKAFINFEDEEYYQDFKNSLLKNASQFGVNDNNFLHTRLIDYCILKLILGARSKLDLNKEIFDLNYIYIKNGYYKTDSNQYLPFDFYRNVLINCINTKNLDYMEEFISNYTKQLVPKHVASVQNYGYALLNFMQGSYSKAFEYINKIKFDQFVFKLDMKNLQLKLSYELNQLEPALTDIDSYRHFIKNNPLLTEHRKLLHKNLLYFTHKLVLYKSGSKKVNLHFIEDKIRKSKNTFDKVWLEEKVKELISEEKKTKVA